MDAVRALHNLQKELHLNVGRTSIKRHHHRRYKHKPSRSQIPRLVQHYAPLVPRSNAEAVHLRASLQAYAATNQGFPILFTSDEVTFVIDTGAIITVTNSKSDFISEMYPVQQTQLQVIAAGLQVQGIGDAEYVFKTDDNRSISIILQNVLYVPQCTVRLLCPRHLAECTTYKTDGFSSIRDIGILTCYGHKISVPYHTGTGLPIISTAAGTKSYSDFCAALTIPNSNETSESLSTLHHHV